MATFQSKLVVGAMLALVCLAGAQILSDQVRHLMVNDGNLIESQQGYAIMEPTLAAMNWKTVTVNGDQVQITAANCQQTVVSKQSLTPDQQTTLQNARQLLLSAESEQPQMAPQNQIFRSGVARYSLHAGTSATVTFAHHIGVSSFQSNGLSLTKYDEQNMSIGKSTGLPDNLNRVFLTGDVVTFVYNDGRILMKPFSCLQPDEQQLIQQLKMEAQQAQGQFKSNMNQFHQNMNDMNRHMQQNFQQMNQNLHQNLDNMFNRNSFPFGPGGPMSNQFQQNQYQAYANPQYNQPQFSFGFPNGFMQGSFRPLMQPVFNGLSSAFQHTRGALANSFPTGQVQAGAGPFSSSFHFQG